MVVHKEDQPSLGLFFLGEAGGVMADCLYFEHRICSCKFKAYCCCVVYLDKKLRSALSIFIINGYWQYTAMGKLAMTKPPIQGGGLEILLGDSSHRNCDEIWPRSRPYGLDVHLSVSK